MFQNRSCLWSIDVAEVLLKICPTRPNFQTDPETGRPVPTGAEVFKRHAESACPTDAFVGSAFVVVGRDDPGAPLLRSVRDNAHITCSLFTVR